MWPGQQPGGDQNPQQPNPYQQPGYQQPNPYQQQGYPQPGYGAQQPGQEQNPYAQQPGQQQWDAPTFPGGPQPPRGGDNKSKTAAIAVVTAVAVIAAAVITGFFVLQDDEKEPTANGGADKSPSADSSAAASEEPSEATPSDDPSQPVVPGWQPVINPKHYSAFDVPKTSDWKVASQSTITGFEDDEGKVLVAMSAPAYYKDEWCKNATRGAVGTKGAQGSRNTKEAAEIAAQNFAIAGYDQDQKGTLKESGAKPFKNSHGIKGHTATVTITDVPKEDKCAADGKVVTVSWLNANDDLAIWVLYTDIGVKDEIPDSTIKKMTNSLRSFGEPGEGDSPRG